MIINGTSNNDTLNGSVENDILSGLKGNDILDGKAGADTYLFNRGDGQDTLADSSNDTNIDQLVFSGSGLTSTNVIVTRVGTSRDLKVAFGGGITDSVLLKDQVYGSGNSLNYGVESVKFSDGVVWNEEQLWAAYLKQGAATNDRLEGTKQNNILRGGLGSDFLDGNAGADTYLFNRGDGQDTLADSSNDTSIDQLVFSGTGLTSTNVIVTRVGTSRDLKVAFGGGITDSVLLKDQVYGSGNSLNYGVESVKFSDGVVWNEEQLWAAYLKQGAATNDRLEGTKQNNILRGGLGSDFLDGNAGADTYLFNRGDGQDTLADSSNDTSIDQLVFSGTGLTSTNVIVTRVGTSRDLKVAFGGGITDSVLLKDQVYGSGNSLNYGVESVKFSDGVVWNEEQLWAAYLKQGAATNDHLEGTRANNTIRGGLGSDFLDGNAGADTYLFNRGDGQDTLADSSNDTSIDQLVFSGTGLTSTNVIVTRVGTSRDLKVAFGGGITDSVLIKDQVYGSGNSLNYGVESVKFSDGVVWNEEKLWAAYLKQGAMTNDRLEGTNANNTIRGGLGNDFLDGKAGADTYLFNLGDGNDTLSDSSNDANVDTLVLSGAGLTSSNVRVTRVGTSNDVQLSFGGGISDTILLKDQLYGGISGRYGIESIKFSNGTTWSESQLWGAIK